MFKVIFDAFLGGTMDKMLKNNNKMTSVSLVLLIAGVYLGYTNHQDILTLNTKFDHVQAALHYELHIDTEQPYSNTPKDSSKVLSHRDAVLANNKLTVVQKDNE